MAIDTIAGLIFVLIIGYIIFRTTKSIFKAIFLALTAGIVILFALSAFIIMDTMDFQKNFPTQPSLFLLEDEGVLVAGFSGVFSEELAPSFTRDLSPYQEKYESGDLEGIKSGNYKLFIIKKQVIESVESLPGDMGLTGQDALELLASETPVDDIVESQLGSISSSQKEAAKQQMLRNMNIETDAEFKGAVFGAMFAAAIQEEGPLLIFDQYKKENILVYPETAMFRFMERMPVSLLNKVIKTVK